MDEATGIRYIIALQAMAGIIETPEQAKIGWDSMADWEKKSTMTVGALLVDKT